MAQNLDFSQLPYENIAKRLAFCAMLRTQLRQHGKSDVLPKRLEDEYEALVAEQYKRPEAWGAKLGEAKK